MQQSNAQIEAGAGAGALSAQPEQIVAMLESTARREAGKAAALRGWAAAGLAASEGLAEVAHDARNMVTALGLYCDLLEQPGVLTAPYAHYGDELKLVAAASRRLVEKLLVLETGAETGTETGAARRPAGSGPVSAWTATRLELAARRERNAATLVDNLAGELAANRNLLAALAGPTIALTLETAGGAAPVFFNSEDLTRVLVNLVKNAAEAMRVGGHIHIALWESEAEPAGRPWLTVEIEDNGPGIPDGALEHIFEPGYSTRPAAGVSSRLGGWPGAQRGLGLSITRSLVEAAGGRIRAANRDPSGACFQITLPVRG